MYLTLTKNNIINNQNLNDLGYYPIIPLSYVWGHITGKYNSSYINTVKTVYNRVNYNISKWNTIPFVETVSYENVDEVINGYGNIVVSDETIEQWQPNRFNAVEQQRVFYSLLFIVFPMLAAVNIIHKFLITFPNFVDK